MAEVGELLSSALLRNLAETSRGITALRQMGFGGKLQRKDTPIDVWALGDALFMNDGALWLYRSLGGVAPVVEVMNALPDDPDLGSLFCDVWVEEAP